MDKTVVQKIHVAKNYGGLWLYLFVKIRLISKIICYISNLILNIMKLLPIIVTTILFINLKCNAAAAARPKGSRMPSQPIKLYYLPPSPPCRSVMMTARALGIDLELVLTNIMEGQHKTPEYLKMNPQHTIPTMDDSGFILWESRAIIAYLVNAYGRNDSLYPKNPRQRALVDQRLNFDLGTLYKRYMDLYAPMLFQGAEYNDEVAEKLNEALSWMNTMLEGRVFLAGDNLTIADISIVVIFTNLEAFEFDFSAHENVAKWFERTKKSLEPYGYEEIDQAGAKILASFMKKE